MEFGNPVVGGVTLVRTDIESRGFITGSAGWRIARSGNAEFNDVTIRGNIALSTAYAPVTSTYDASLGGGPTWATTGSFVAFNSSAWGPVDIPVPASGRVRYEIRLLALNNNTNASTLTVDLQVLLSSGGTYPTATGWVAPGVLSHPPNLQDGCVMACQVAASPAVPSATSYVILDGFVQGQWLRFIPQWRISSGSAATVAFPNLSQRFTVTPIV